MKEILLNLALIEANKFCKENGIDYSGTHLVKEPKPFTYSLNKNNGHQLVRVQFHKNSVPIIYAYKY
jgi:hypothetical protein